MSARSNSETEQCWIDAWNELYALAQGLSRVEIVLPDGVRADLEAAQGWLQSSAYQGFALGLRRYRRGDLHQIHASRWPWGSAEPAWISKTQDGFLLDNKMVI